MKRFSSALILVLVTAMLLSSCHFFEQEKTFTVEDMSITLTDYFYTYYPQGYTVLLQSNEISIFGVMYPFDMMGESELTPESSIEEFGEELLKSNEREGLELVKKDGLSYYFYEDTSEETQETYSYLTMLYKSEEAFWLLQFVCKAEQYEKLESELFQYAASVTFTSREAE